MIQEIKICSKCEKPKPYPSDFITSFKRNIICGQCKDCRKEVRLESRKRLNGNTSPEARWNHPMRKDHLPLHMRKNMKFDI